MSGSLTSTSDREPSQRTSVQDDELDELREPIIGPLSMQAVTLLFSGIFLLVGVLGFVPGVTTDLHFSSHGPRFSGPGSHAMLFGVFMVSVLHNFVHLAYAAVGSVASFFAQTVRVYFVLGGLVYIAVFVYGAAIDRHSSANFVPVNSADNWLHLGLGILMIATGVLVHVRLQRARRIAARELAERD